MVSVLETRLLKHGIERGKSAALERVETRGLTSGDRLGSKTRERRRRSNATHTRRGPVEKARRMKKRERDMYMSAHRGAGQASICPRQCRLGRTGSSIGTERDSLLVEGTPLLLTRVVRENPRTGELAREISYRDRSLVSLARVLFSPAHPSPFPRSLLVPRRPRSATSRITHRRSSERDYRREIPCSRRKERKESGGEGEYIGKRISVEKWCCC